ncbi:hypothetical protein [Allomuricauda sp. F6463D]|uniref:hypothetical protein n=1 Tax=Allomuricauda sp. F6463D TaxID=2926409 RepID=UPI001FF50091|nr:hypothetical protein [Muricauda sp. F6463D]MCK0159112.1 hypothetical protein [Muricauda sp. F6463D]
MCKDVFFKTLARKCMIFCLLCVTALFQVQCSGGKNIAEPFNRESKLSERHAFFDDSWLETVRGNMPLVISAPHGGTISPETIEDRDCGTKVMDNNTAELAFEIKNALEQLDKRPHLIVARLARTKVDFNRNMEQATCGNQQMEYTWHQYHKYIEESIDAAIKEFGYAMYIDLHGQSHAVKRLELGYLLRAPALQENFKSTGNDSEIGTSTSLQNLLENNQRLILKELLTGENAFGTLMEKSGYPAVPSLDDPFPKGGEPYFNGGYNTRRYTSSDYPKVFGMQIEANFTDVRDSEENRIKFANAFTRSVLDYLNFIESNWEY